MREAALPPADPATSPTAARMKSSLYKTDRSHSEVGDTLRYFNSVSSSKSWCGDVGSYGYGYGGGSELYLGGGGGEDGLALSLSLSEDASSLGNDNLGYGRISGGSGGSSGGRGGRNKCRSGSAQVLGVSSPVGAARFNSVVGFYQVDQM